MKKCAALVAAAMASSTPSYSQNSNSTQGACSPIITGNQGSVITNNCNNRPKPTIEEIRPAVAEYNQFPAYQIEGIEYRNGYSEEGDKYVVGLALQIRMRASCDEMSKPGWGEIGGDKITGFVVGLAALKIAYQLGMHCRVGERFSLLVADELQKTENGWSVIKQESMGAERR